MPKTFKIVGVAASGPAAGKTAGEDIILVGDTDSIKGTKGDTGAAGPAGTVMLHGDGVPGGEVGENGEWYLDTTASNLYGPKTAGAWGDPTSLIGAAGATVLNGAVPPTSEGKVGDFYIDTDAAAIYGPKTDPGGWGDPTDLVGADGAAWTPTVDNSGTVTLDTGNVAGVIEVGTNLYLPVYGPTGG